MRANVKLFVVFAVGLAIGIALTHSSTDPGGNSRPHEPESVSKRRAFIVANSAVAYPFWIKGSVDLPVYSVNVGDKKFSLDAGKASEEFPIIGQIGLDVDGQKVTVLFGVPLVSPKGELVKPDRTLPPIDPAIEKELREWAESRAAAKN